jgi:hypothetical protein
MEKNQFLTLEQDCFCNERPELLVQGELVDLQLAFTGGGIGDTIL